MPISTRISRVHLPLRVKNSVNGPMTAVLNQVAIRVTAVCRPPRRPAAAWSLASSSSVAPVRAATGSGRIRMVTTPTSMNAAMAA